MNTGTFKKDIILSEDGNTVIIVDPDTGEDEQLSRKEYESMYGEIEEQASLDKDSADVDDAAEGYTDEAIYDPNDRYKAGRWQDLDLTKNFIKVNERRDYLSNLDETFPLDVQRAYYSALLELTYTVGDVIWAKKAGINAYDEAVFPVQKMLGEYDLRGANLDCITEGYMIRRTSVFNEVFAWSNTLGYLPISGVGRERIFRFLEDGGHRRWFRNRVKKLLEADGEVYDIGQLMAQRYALIRRRKK